jgi:uncharacterized protein
LSSSGQGRWARRPLALAVAEGHDSVYLDLESEADRARLSEPELYFGDHLDQLVILDEIHRAPGIFEALRGVIDRGRREGEGTGRFLLLGSAAIELLAQSGETGGRPSRLHRAGTFRHNGSGSERLDPLWIRGGFPESFLAADDQSGLRWRRDFIRTYLERDIPQLGPRIPAETLRRLWTMLAHQQGGCSTPRSSPAGSG